MKLFMLKGDADSVSTMTRDFNKKNRRVDTVKLVTL